VLWSVSPGGVLSQEVEDGRERPEDVVRLDVKFEEILGHASIVASGVKEKLKKR
jgi:hypothetical protein